MIYFDYNATTPLHPAALEAWLKATRDHWHNASSLYREAASTAQLLDAARERLAELLGCEAQRIVFTSGATEANNALLHHLAGASEGVVLVSSLEHPSIRVPSRHWLGNRIRDIPAARNGRVDLDWVRDQLLHDRVGAVVVMAVAFALFLGVPGRAALAFLVVASICSAAFHPAGADLGARGGGRGPARASQAASPSRRPPARSTSPIARKAASSRRCG